MNKQSIYVVYSSAKQLVRCGIRNQVSTQYGIPVTLGRYASLPTAGGIADEGCLGLLAFVIAVAGSPHRTMAGAKPLNTTMVDISGNILAAERFTVELAEIYTGSG